MKSNAEELKTIGLKNTELVLSIKKKKLAYYGHVRRHHSLQKLVLEGKVCLFGFLTSSSTTRLYCGRAPRQERLTILRAATHETELGDHDFCLSRSHEGKVDGKRGRGRRRKSWTGNVSEMTKMSMAQCSVKALDRSVWRTMISNLYAETKPR